MKAKDLDKKLDSGDNITEFLNMKFVKYHGLGNDYLVIQPEDFFGTLEASQVQGICDRNHGIYMTGAWFMNIHLQLRPLEEMSHAVSMMAEKS